MVMIPVLVILLIVVIVILQKMGVFFKVKTRSDPVICPQNDEIIVEDTGGAELEPLTPSSSSPRTAEGSLFDVFLSFRGEDTRKGFTGHLHEGLHTRGISTFIDSENLEKGEEIEGLLGYIEKSKICIPIFSKGYADSKWCLRELAQIVKCKKEVLPVFFDVDPSDVKKQSGPFASAFEKHESDRELEEEEVRKWREALTRVGNISGFSLKEETDGNEAKLIRLIVKRILREVNKTSRFVAKHPVGLDSRIENVMKMLETDAQGDVKMVGIHGIGGMGKTTLANAVYNQISTQFDACSFISDVREEAKQFRGLATLQQRLLREVFNDKTINVNDTDEGIGMIRQRIRSKKVLLVLDDVDHKSQLVALAGGLDWFCSGSRIIITTRNKQVLRAQRVLNLYELKGLDDNQSLQLFSWHAFGKEEPNEEFAKLSTEVAATAAGLPLALEIFGSHFFDLQTIKEWRDMLEMLKEDQEKDIHGRLRISFDTLNEKEKKVFLDIACFFVGQEIKLPTLMWEDCKFFPDTTIKVLVHKSLVNINDRTGEFEMHDHIRDMGRKIVQDESLSNPEMCRSRWYMDALDVQQNKREMKNVEAIELFFSRRRFFGSFVSASEEFFTTMSQLRMLRLREGVTLEGEHEHFPSNLRWLEWHPRDLDSLPDGLYLENIVILDLSESSITQLCNPRTYARIKAFGKLKVLNLYGCDNLISCPDFKSMPHLQELDLGGCGEMSELHPSIGHLKQLTHLSLGFCSSLKELPPEVWQLTSLQKLNLSCCSQITTLPPQQELLLNQLKVLNLYGCQKLRICPEFTSMPHLETLSFEDCGEMSELHPSIGHLKQLTHLSLIACYSLKELPQEVWQLTSLKEFDLSGCSQITALPPQEQLLLDKLKVLNLRGCRKLKICPEFTSMPLLVRLSFDGCGEMSELHPSIGCLKSLTYLSLAGCPSLKELPEQIWQLTSLETLGLRECYEITARPSHLGDSESLKQPFLGNKLKTLRLDGCKNITKSPDFTSMPHLETLDLSGCEKMSELHPSIGHLKVLTKLNLSGCKSLKELPREIWQLTSLEEFNLSNCSQITALPSQLGDSKSLGKLKVLKLSGCENLTTCPDFMSMLKCLTVLDLSDCISLKELPVEVGQLTSLQRLTLDSCSQISTLPESMGYLKQLNDLSLSKCNSLKEIPKCNVSLDMLEELTVAGCEQLKFLPQLPPSLTKLDAGGCRQLKIIENISNLERLCELSLYDCESLVDVRGIEKLECLEVLMLGGCRSLCNSFWEIIQETDFKDIGKLSIPGSPIKSEASCLQSLSFLLPKQFMGALLWFYVDQSSLDNIRSELGESNGASKLDKSIESEEDRNPDSIPSDDEVTPPIDSLLGRVVRIDITVEDAQDSFSALVNKRDDGSRSYYFARFGRYSNLMMTARGGGFAGYHSNASQRKTWMMMRVSIDGCVLLHGDLFTSISSSDFDDDDDVFSEISPSDFFDDNVGHNIVFVLFGL